MHRYLVLGAMLVLFTAQGVQQAYGWDLIARQFELFAVGEIEGKSYLYKIDPLTGEFEILGDTGLNNCRGLDFTPDGKLKAYCEPRTEEYVMAERLLVGADGVVVELDADDAFPEWAVPTGISNLLSDITIREDGTHFSHERDEVETLHKHLEEDDFNAIPIGQTGIDAFDLAMASWGLDVLKVAANDGGPKLFSVNPANGNILSTNDLVFPENIVFAANSTSQRAVAIEQVQFGSMDSIKFDTRVEPITVLSRAGGYGFAERDAEFAAYIYETPLKSGDFESAEIEEIWGAIALIDADTNRVDYIVELQGGPAELTALALRSIGPRPIPTMSEWAMIAAALSLGIIGLVAIRKRKYSEV